MPGQELTILSVGMVTSVGIGARQTAASVRAGIARFGQTSIYNKRFQPFKMALLPEEALPPLEASLEVLVGLTARQMRMLRLAAPALREVLVEVPNPDQVPVLLGTPEAFPGRPDPTGEKFLDHLAVQAGLKFNVSQSKLVPGGRASGLMALKEGVEWITSGKQKYVIVGGVDTYLDLYLLGALDRENRILAEGVMDGFVPGEGAGFLLLSTDKVKSTELKPIASVEAAAVGIEKGHRYSEEVYRGDGLSETFQTLFNFLSSSNEKVQTVFAGFNGESFGSKEWGVAYLRNKDRFAGAFRLEHPVDCFGDTGAALGPIMMGLATIGMQKGYIKGPCLVWCPSDREERAAVLIQGLKGG